MSGILPISLQEIKAYFDIIELNVSKEVKKIILDFIIEMDNELLKRTYKNG